MALPSWVEVIYVIPLYEEFTGFKLDYHPHLSLCTSAMQGD